MYSNEMRGTKASRDLNEGAGIFEWLGRVIDRLFFKTIKLTHTKGIEKNKSTMVVGT